MLFYERDQPRPVLMSPGDAHAAPCNSSDEDMEAQWLTDSRHLMVTFETMAPCIPLA